MGPKGQRRRQQFLRTALEMFSAQGYEATTTRAVAEAAGTGESLLFRYFPTKQELFRAVVAEHGPGALFDLPDDGLAELPFAEALSCFARSYLDTLWEHRQWLGVLHREAQRETVAREELTQQYRVVGEALWALLREGVDRGKVRPAVAGAAAQIISLATRGFVARVAQSEPADWERERDTFIANLTEVVAHGALMAHKTREATV